MGATSTVRNPQQYSLATEQQTTSSFGRLLHKSRLHVVYHKLIKFEMEM
jgi:hypothetical protein